MVTCSLTMANQIRLTTNDEDTKMRKPKFLNKPEETTISGKKRKKHRMFNREEIEFLKQPMYQRFAEHKDFTAIRWNFNLNFNWNPDLNSLKSFYGKKTYKWCWENLDEIQDTKVTRKYCRIEEYRDDLRQILEDPYYGSCEENFKEIISELYPQITYSKGMFSNLRYRFGMTRKNRVKEEIEAITDYIKSKADIENPIDSYKELIKKYPDLTNVQYNNYAQGAGCKVITPKHWKEFQIENALKDLKINSFEVRYAFNGKFLVDTICLPEDVVEHIKTKLAEKLI